MSVLAVALLLLGGAGDEAISQARAKYDAVAYDEAAHILEAAQKDPALSAAERARVLAFEALVHAQMADDVTARKNLDDALTLDACVALPDAPAPPRIRAMLAAARDARVHGLPPPLTAPAPTSSTTTTTATSGAPLLFAGAAMGGAGLLAFGGAALAGGLGLGAHGAATSAQFQSDVLAHEDAARTDFVVADVLAASGAVLVVGGGVLGTSSPRRS